MKLLSRFWTSLKQHLDNCTPPYKATTLQSVRLPGDKED